MRQIEATATAKTNMQQTTLYDLLTHASRESAMDRLMTAKAEGRRAMEAVAKASGPDFQHRAYEFAVLYEVVR